MSIKVYEAYQLKEGVDPFDLLAEFKQQGQRIVRERLTKIYRDILEGRSQENALRLQKQDALFKAWLEEQGHPKATLSLYSKWDGCPKELRPDPNVITISNEEILATKHGHKKVDVFSIEDWITTKYGETLTQHEWDPWALDASITVRQYEGRYYIIPYCDHRCYLGGLFKFLEEDDRLQDFAYWNNTDPPENVNPKEWEHRSEVWNELTRTERWPLYLLIDIVSWRGWHEVSPMFEIIQS